MRLGSVISLLTRVLLLMLWCQNLWEGRKLAWGVGRHEESLWTDQKLGEPPVRVWVKRRDPLEGNSLPHTEVPGANGKQHIRREREGSVSVPLFLQVTMGHPFRFHGCARSGAASSCRRLQLLARGGRGGVGEGIPKPLCGRLAITTIPQRLPSPAAPQLPESHPSLQFQPGFCLGSERLARPSPSCPFSASFPGRRAPPDTRCATPAPRCHWRTVVTARVQAP